jgi:phospholipid/cholesterol/gamma-HCH transport system substrate-binding protein
MTSFRERDPRPIAIASLIALAAFTQIGVNAARLPFLHPRHHYTVMLIDSAGLIAGNDVDMAGIKVGEVNSVKVRGDEVVVDIKVDTAQHLGDQSTASVELATLLGTKYLNLTSAGSHPLSGAIPTSRTSVPFDLTQVLSTLGSTAGDLDQVALQKALGALTQTMAAAQPSVRPLLTGLSQLSETVARKNNQLGDLLAASKTVSATLAKDDTKLIAIMGDADLVLRTINERSAAIRSLLRDIDAMSAQISGLVTEDRAALDPLLDHLHTVSTLLASNLPSLAQTARLLAPFTRYFTNAVGNGRWADLYVNSLLTPDNVLCTTTLSGQCQ